MVDPCDTKIKKPSLPIVVTAFIWIPHKYYPGGYALSVRRSRTGKGLFAAQDIPKGSCILEYTGRLLSAEEAERGNGKYYFEVSAKQTIDGNVRTNLARYINHSCRPNCQAEGPRGRVFIVAIRDIKAGKELTYDYGKQYYDEHIKPKGCRCLKCSP
jgi:SET domain-containing protein